MNDLVVNGRMENIPIALGESMIGDHALLQYSAASSFFQGVKFFMLFIQKINVNVDSTMPQGGVCNCKLSFLEQAVK